jgi:hypothetical protein
MKVEVFPRNLTTTPGDSHTMSLKITATGKAGDNVNLPDGLTSLPYNGPYTIDWGDNTPWEIVQQPDNNPVMPFHDYGNLNGAFRVHVRGDAAITRHVLVS